MIIMKWYANIQMLVKERIINRNVCKVNSHILASSLKENDYRMFWVFRVYRSPSSKAYELYGNDITHDTDRSYIVWFDEEKK